MKSVLISLQPKYCELIARGKKTVEVRKTRPKLETPFKCYIYETKAYDTLFGKGKPKRLCVGGGKVIGEFVCDKLIWVIAHPEIFAGHPLLYSQAIKDACMTDSEAEAYSNGKDLYGWHISDLVIYDKPKPLSKFISCKFHWDCGACCYYDREQFTCDKQIRPPQSWCYVESEG